MVAVVRGAKTWKGRKISQSLGGNISSSGAIIRTVFLAGIVLEGETLGDTVGEASVEIGIPPIIRSSCFKAMGAGGGGRVEATRFFLRCEYHSLFSGGAGDDDAGRLMVSGGIRSGEKGWALGRGVGCGIEESRVEIRISCNGVCSD